MRRLAAAALVLLSVAASARGTADAQTLVPRALEASPDMGVTGPGSGGNTFSWPHPVVYSLPLWVYRTIMFIWALWIAVALARRLRFAWQAWSAGGIWRGELIAPAPDAAGQTAP